MRMVQRYTNFGPAIFKGKHVTDSASFGGAPGAIGPHVKQQRNTIRAKAVECRLGILREDDYFAMPGSGSRAHRQLGGRARSQRKGGKAVVKHRHLVVALR